MWVSWSLPEQHKRAIRLVALIQNELNSALYSPHHKTCLASSYLCRTVAGITHLVAVTINIKQLTTTLAIPHSFKLLPISSFMCRKELRRTSILIFYIPFLSSFPSSGLFSILKSWFHFRRPLMLNTSLTVSLAVWSSAWLLYSGHAILLKHGLFLALWCVSPFIVRYFSFQR